MKKFIPFSLAAYSLQARDCMQRKPVSPVFIWISDHLLQGEGLRIGKHDLKRHTSLGSEAHLFWNTDERFNATGMPAIANMTGNLKRR